MLRTAVYLLAWLAFLIAAVALAARFVPVINHTVLLVAALSPYLMSAAVLSAALLLATHRWWAAAAAIALALAAMAVELPLFVGSDPDPGHTVPVRVLTANLLEGNADPVALFAAAEQTDVVVVQELTTELAERITRERLDAEFPFRALDAQSHANGVGIWSRFPITTSNRDSNYKLGMVTASLRPPGASSDVVVLAAHLAGPWPQSIQAWRREIAKLPATMRVAAAMAGDGAVIVAGDLNATADMQPFRRLLRDGFSDAAAQSGSGLVRTFPADRSVPPLIGIDHILTANGSAGDVRTVRIPGSDHLGLAATVRVPG